MVTIIFKKITIGLIVLWAISLSAFAETYVYIEKDGTRWLTDRKLPEENFTFVEIYGRPTATKSCKGVTSSIMSYRASRYMKHINHYSEKYNVDPYLIKAVITVESCFDPRAISRAGARGLMQLMPATAKDYQLFNRFQPEGNIRAGTHHLSDLLKHYQNNTSLSLAAYNAGRKAVEKYNGIPPYKETQGYVKKVLRYYKKYKSQISSSRQSMGNP